MFREIREIKKSEKLYDNKKDEKKGFMEIKSETERSVEDLMADVQRIFEIETNRKGA